MRTRRPAVADMFYPGDADALRRLVESCFTGPGGPGALPEVGARSLRQTLGLVVPHAGLIYSGSVAACGYYRLAEDGIPSTVVIVGPNHRAYYPAVALTDDDAWQTPFGRVSVDGDVTRKILAAIPSAVVDSGTHAAEHSLEVQLPFLQYIAGSAPLSIVPILIGSAAQSAAVVSAVEVARELGRAIAEALAGKDAVVIASTDFTHYETGETAARQDSHAMSAILRMDEEALIETVRAHNISMCGPLPSAIAIVAARALGASAARRLAYRNSGDVTGVYNEVVGYASVEFHRQVMR